MADDAANNDAAGVAVSKWAQYNTAGNKNQKMKDFRAQDHEAAIKRLLRQCHSEWTNGGYEAALPRPGPKVGHLVPQGTAVTVFDVGHQRWVHALVHRVISARKDGHLDAVAAVVEGDGVYVCPLQVAAMGHVAPGAAH